MMNRSPRQLAFIGLAILAATFSIALWAKLGFSVAVMMLIAAAGVLTIVTVLMIGATHSEGPVGSSDSQAVDLWQQRIAKRQKSAPVAEATTSEET